jgi:hypothetical protein
LIADPDPDADAAPPVLVVLFPELLQAASTVLIASAPIGSASRRFRRRGLCILMPGIPRLFLGML